MNGTNSDRKILSVHIEKTAGTSFQAFWEDLFGKEQVLIYNKNKNMFIRSSDFWIHRTSLKYELIKHYFLSKNVFVRKIYRRLIYLINAISFARKGIPVKNIPINFKVVHGHFNANLFKEELNKPYIFAIFREPLERMISQFLHWKRNLGVSYWRANIPYSSKISFEQYSFHPKLRNYQSKILSSIDINDLTTIGVVDHLDEFVNTIRKVLIKDGEIEVNTQFVKFKKFNVRWENMGLKITNQFRKSFRKYHAEDYKIYEMIKKNKVFVGKNVN